MTVAPSFAVLQERSGAQIVLRGSWSATQGDAVEKIADELARTIPAGPSELDMSGVERLDTLGAWVINRLLHMCAARDARITLKGVREAQEILLREAAYRAARVWCWRVGMFATALRFSGKWLHQSGG